MGPKRNSNYSASRKSTVNRDLSYLRIQARNNITKYIDYELPFEYDKCLVALNSLQKKAWEISESADIEERTKVQALSLAKECVINKLELLTNATVVDDAIRFVSEHQQQSKGMKLKMSIEEDDKGSKEPNYNEYKQGEEEDGTGEMTISTTNEVF